MAHRCDKCGGPFPPLAKDNRAQWLAHANRWCRAGDRYLNLWDTILRPFGRCVWRNPKLLLGVQIERLPR